MKRNEINILIILGNNVTLLMSKMTGGKDLQLNEQLQIVVSIRFQSNNQHFGTAHVITPYTFLTTAEIAIAVQNDDNTYSIHYGDGTSEPIISALKLVPRLYFLRKKSGPQQIYDNFNIGIIIVSFS